MALHPPEAHGSRCEGGGETDKDIGVQEQLPVCKSIFLDVSRLAGKQVGFALLLRHAERRGKIGANADKNHLNVGQNLGETKEEAEEHSPELGELSKQGEKMKSVVEAL